MRGTPTIVATTTATTTPNTDGEMTPRSRPRCMTRRVISERGMRLTANTDASRGDNRRRDGRNEPTPVPITAAASRSRTGRPCPIRVVGSRENPTYTKKKGTNKSYTESKDAPTLTARGSRLKMSPAKNPPMATESPRTAVRPATISPSPSTVIIHVGTGLHLLKPAGEWFLEILSEEQASSGENRELSEEYRGCGRKGAEGDGGPRLPLGGKCREEGKENHTAQVVELGYVEHESPPSGAQLIHTPPDAHGHTDSGGHERHGCKETGKRAPAQDEVGRTKDQANACKSIHEPDDRGAGEPTNEILYVAGQADSKEKSDYAEFGQKRQEPRGFRG